MARKTDCASETDHLKAFARRYRNLNKDAQSKARSYLVIAQAIDSASCLPAAIQAVYQNMSQEGTASLAIRMVFQNRDCRTVSALAWRMLAEIERTKRKRRE